MKNILLSFLFISIAASATYACDFKFSVLGNKKEVYQVGDTLTIHVEYVLTHRVCKILPKDTKFKFDGIKITGATEWTEATAGTFTRNVKALVIDDKKDKFMLTATRTCDKEGGHGVFTVSKKP